MDNLHDDTEVYVLYLSLFAQHGWTPLFAAAYKGHKDVVKYLLEEQHCSTTVVDAVSLL